MRMSVLNRRVQVLFDPGEYALLEAEARRRHRSVGALVRESVRHGLSQHADEKRATLARLLERADSSPGSPVGDWKEVKDGFEREALGTIR